MQKNNANNVQQVEEKGEDAEPELDEMGRKVKWIQSLSKKEGILESPINLSLTIMEEIELNNLVWRHVDLIPKKVKLTNTGHTLILSGKWHQERPFLSSGPLPGNYVFSQLHFHWGTDNMEGSEHSVDGTLYPLEMHVVHFKSCYLTQETALKQNDGMACVVFFFKLQSFSNPAVEVLTEMIPFVQQAHTSVRMNPLPLSFIVKPFIKDYFFYWGAVTTQHCVHRIMWLIGREPIGIAADQLEVFRTTYNANQEVLSQNFRSIQPLQKRKVFHINPSGAKFATLLPPPLESEPVKKGKAEPSYTQTQQVYTAMVYPMRTGKPLVSRPTSSKNSKQIQDLTYLKFPENTNRNRDKNEEFNGSGEYEAKISSTAKKKDSPSRDFSNCI